MFTYALSPEADISNTSYVGEVELTPARLVARFGPPRRGDETRISGQYVFSDEQGHVFTVYDWKCTSTWEIAEGHVAPGLEPSLPTPEELWAFDEPWPLNIGGEDGSRCDHFVHWLKIEVGEPEAHNGAR